MSHPLVNGGHAVVEALVTHGVDTVFGIPGTHNLAIYSALQATNIRHISPRHEQGAGYSADGYASLSGRPGVCITTTGPAILNAATAAAQAYSDSIPVLFIAPGMPLRHPGGHNGLLHEVKNQFDAMEAVVGHAQRVTSVEELPHAIAQCFAAMSTGRPRPAYLEIPLDLLEEETEPTEASAVVASTPVADETQLEAAAHLIQQARRPLVIAGGGCSAAAQELRSFAELVNAPVITTANGKGALPESHALSLGAGVQHPSLLELVEESDLLVAVGTELSPADWWWGPPHPSCLIRIDVDPLSIATNVHPTVGIIGDAGNTLASLAKRVSVSNQVESGHVGQWRSRLREEARAEGAQYLGLVEALSEALDEDAVVAADSSMSCYYGLLANLPLHRPRSFLYPAGLGTLGYGLPAAVGAKVADPQRPVVAVLGDGGLMFTVAELASAAAAALPIPVVVVENGGYGEIRNEMTSRDGRSLAVDLPTPDLVALARALGCHGVSAHSSADVRSAVESAFTTDRPTLIVVREQPGF